MVEIEIAVQDVRGARIAKELGADRIELCSALSLGGLTPPLGLIEQAVAHGPPVHVLIRPRAGGFTYTPEEVELILADIRHAVAAGASGIVVGALNGVGMPDLARLEEFVGAAGGREATFHRAIDVAADMVAAAESLSGTGVTRILTSGGAASADRGREMLTRLIEVCGREIQVQAGAGINPGNASAVAQTGVAAVHFSATGTVSPAAPQRAVDFGGYDTIDRGLAAATIAALRGP